MDRKSVIKGIHRKRGARLGSIFDFPSALTCAFPTPRSDSCRAPHCGGEQRVALRRSRIAVGRAGDAGAEAQQQENGEVKQAIEIEAPAHNGKQLKQSRIVVRGFDWLWDHRVKNRCRKNRRFTAPEPET